MTDMNRPSPEQTAAFRTSVLAMKRDAVYEAAKRYYTLRRTLGESEDDRTWLQEAWRPVRYAVEDWVITAAEREI